MASLNADLVFHDAYTHIGTPLRPPMRGPADMRPSAEGLLRAMDRAGIARALVWHTAQQDADPLVGNTLLAEAIAPHERLTGCWALLPNQTGELGDSREWFRAALKAGARACQVFPEASRFLLRADVLGEVLERMIAARLPLVLPMNAGVSWDAACDLLAELPELTVILSGLGCWGADRYVRPLLERYPRVHIEISQYIVDGGLEGVARDYGADRLLFGSGYPSSYHGAAMFMLAHAELEDAEKRAIAGGNLDRLLGEVKV
jgi:predicted TIM-barrel fold metal-dependent hydrolase